MLDSILDLAVYGTIKRLLDLQAILITQTSNTVP